MMGNGLGRCISDRANKDFILACDRTELSAGGWVWAGD
jgi:hypothetical protein